MSWSALVSAAVVGTERRPPAHALQDDPLLAAVLGEAERPAAEALLDAAAAYALARQAAQRPDPGPLTALEPCPPETAPPLPDGALALLGRLLHDQRTGAEELFALALTRAAAHGYVAPAALAPALLDLAEQIPAALDVAGARGRWLARLGEPWRALAEPDPEAWATAADWERVALLGRLRSRDPAAARALVESTWEEDRAETRARLITILGAAPDAADEPLLERALDDRRKEVREAAARALARLPGSALARRMGERAAPLVRRREIELPGAPDAAGVRDGLEAGTRAGARTRDLERIATAAPLAAWGKPTTLVKAGLASDHAEALARGWSAAALTQRNAEWARALVAAAVPATPELLALLPATEADAAGAAWIAEHGDRTVRVLHTVPAPWGPKTSKAVLEGIAAHIAHPSAWLDENALALAGARLHASARAAAQRTVAPLLEAGGRRAVAGRDLLDLLELRLAIDQELPPT